jgi:hypothetical protein
MNKVISTINHLWGRKRLQKRTKNLRGTIKRRKTLKKKIFKINLQVLYPSLSGQTMTTKKVTWMILTPSFNKMNSMKWAIMIIHLESKPTSQASSNSAMIKAPSKPIPTSFIIYLESKMKTSNTMMAISKVLSSSKSKLHYGDRSFVVVVQKKS